MFFSKCRTLVFSIVPLLYPSNVSRSFNAAKQRSFPSPGNDGLGFSITTRDNPAGGNTPIFVKSIMPKGAAIEEGQLRSGDQIVEVCTIFFEGFLWTSLKTLFKAGQMRARVSAPVQFLLSFGLKTLITLGDSHSLWTAVVFLNQVVFRTVLDRLFSSRLALAWELYGSFGICSYSKF